MRVVICGGGNAIHALVPVLKSNGAWVGVLAPYADEAKRLEQGALAGGIRATLGDRVLQGAPDAVAAEPAAVIPGADIVLIAVPAFTHAAFVDLVLPHLREGAWLGAMPARSGFEFYANLPAVRSRGVTLFGFQTLPWACRVVEYGRQIAILGQKAGVDLAATPASLAPAAASAFQPLLGLPVNPVKSMTTISLGNVGQLIHPGIMYGLFYGREAVDYAADAVPLFYQGVSEATAAVLEAMSDEVLAVARTLERLTGSRLDLSEVPSLYQWLIDSYAASIGDRTSLRTCFTTNAAYRGLKAPMLQDGERCRPDFKARYLTEDVPFGLVVTKGLADLAGVKTPVIDRVLATTAGWMGAEYYVAGQPAGKDIAASRHPVNFGINSLNQLLDSSHTY